MSPRRDTPARSGRRRVALTAWSPLVVLAFGANCAGSTASEEPSAALVSPLAATTLGVDTSLEYQRITGFGASSAWTGGSISEDLADLFFSPERGLGLSLLRMHIAPDGSTSELLTAQRARARGVKVWAAPWSPPGEWKTSGTDTDGGSLLPEHYQEWADRLAGFAANMAVAGVPLMGLSAQNEPNWTASWETCTYTPDDLTTFVRDYLAPSLARSSPGTRLIAPESANWTALAEYADPLLADPDARDAFDIVATHAYGGTPYAYTAATDHGKELWETEVSIDDGDTTLAAALDTAQSIQRHLTVASVNAFHWWWLLSDSTAGLYTNGALTPQAYGLAHFSKFVRPGFVRVDVPADPATGVSASAYRDPVSGGAVVVLVNTSGSDARLSLSFTSVTATRVEPWVTNATESLTPRAPFAYDGPFSFTLEAQSIASLVLTDHPETSGGGGEGGTPAVGAAGEAGALAASGAAGSDDTSAVGGRATNGSGGGTTANGHAGKSSSSKGGSSGHGTGGTGNLPSHAGTTSLAGVPAVTHHSGEALACTFAAGGRAGSNAGWLPGLGLALLGLRRRRRAALQ